jgi:hypothetical protein
LDGGSIDSESAVADGDAFFGDEFPHVVGVVAECCYLAFFVARLEAFGPIIGDAADVAVAIVASAVDGLDFGAVAVNWDFEVTLVFEGAFVASCVWGSIGAGAV